jgi:hypothetical protein
MAVAGAIAEHTRAVLPVTWDMLSTSQKFGDASLRITIDTVKESLFGTVSDPEDEANLPLTVIRYVAKMVALELITPGIDAWRDNPISLVTTGTNEQTTYSDPVAALQQLRKDLLAETRAAWGDVAPLIDFRRLSGGPRPLINTLNDEFLTPSPQEFPRPYRVTERT